MKEEIITEDEWRAEIDKLRPSTGRIEQYKEKIEYARTGSQKVSYVEITIYLQSIGCNVSETTVRRWCQKWGLK